MPIIDLYNNDILELNAEVNYGGFAKSGVSDYTLLTNKPTINGIELVGNVTTSQLGIKNGQDGVSPTITPQQTDNGYEITIVDVDGTDTISLTNGEDGLNGKSAYQIAVDNGFSGSEKEWVESLKGQDGENATINGMSTVNIVQGSNIMISQEGSTLTISATGGSGGTGGVTIEEVRQEIDTKVPAWSREPTKPTYTAEEIGALPSTTKIPTKVSELMNDSGYITSIPTEYITDVEMQEYAQPKGNYALKSELFSKSYNDLSDKPTIPTKVSQLTNDSNFITSIPAEYITETEMQAYAQPKGNYTTQEYVDGLIGDISTILDNINGEVI